MSDGKRSRRRFLADMLFVGAGLTAAGMLAQAQSPGPQTPPGPETPPDPGPAAAGEMVMPSAPSPAPPSGPVPSCDGTPEATRPTHEPRPQIVVEPPKCSPRGPRHVPAYQRRPRSDKHIEGMVKLPTAPTRAAPQ